MRAAAERVRDSLRRLAEALRAGDRRDINRATAEVRVATRDVARACNVPVDRFRG
ncbi:MAG TPA: hypothetical protein VKP11_02320 [Frankiaceae bacterium]|nr:hypothetical protein [Frankiaceae bacterium]